jgi:molybdopterin molybdotransferase
MAGATPYRVEAREARVAAIVFAADSIAAAADACSDADLLITTGGASVGDHDLEQAGLAMRGFRPNFWKIAMRPGKPLLFGLIGDRPVIGMPGNPVSALVCALLFVRPAIAAMLGLPANERLFETATLGAPMPANDGREDYVRTRLERDADGGLVAHPFPTQDSSMLLTLAQADGLVRRRPLAPPISAGEPVDVIVFDRVRGCY